MRTNRQRSAPWGRKMKVFNQSKLGEKILWTHHIKEKMRYYRLSENRLKRVLRNPKRIEEGVAPKTVAIMQPTGSQKHPTEIWLMYQKASGKIKMISAWRYPGISLKHQPPPIPEGVWRDLEETK